METNQHVLWCSISRHTVNDKSIAILPRKLGNISEMERLKRLASFDLIGISETIHCSTTCILKKNSRSLNLLVVWYKNNYLGVTTSYHGFKLRLLSGILTNWYFLKSFLMGRKWVANWSVTFWGFKYKSLFMLSFLTLMALSENGSKFNIYF